MASLAYYLGTCNDENTSIWKSAPIEKGLIPRLLGREIDLVEEGIGFGVPVLQCTRDFFFPGTAIAAPNGELQDGIARKAFVFDLIERAQESEEKTRVKTFSWLFTRLMNAVFKTIIGPHLLRLYDQHFKLSRPIFKLEPKKFIRVQDHGIASSHYAIDAVSQQINVLIDFSGVSKQNLQRIYVSNELGGRLFTRYLDGSRLQLHDKQINGWSKINTSWALFYAPSLCIGFMIDIPQGVEAYRGRETATGDICWSGIIFSVPPSTVLLNYTILIGSMQQLQAVIKNHD